MRCGGERPWTSSHVSAVRRIVIRACELAALFQAPRVRVSFVHCISLRSVQRVARQVGCVSALLFLDPIACGFHYK